MKFTKNPELVKLNRREQKLLRQDEKLVFVGQLRCAERLDDLSKEIEAVSAEREKLRKDYPIYDPTAGSIFPDTHTFELHSLHRKLERVTVIASLVLIHETEQLLDGPMIDSLRLDRDRRRLE